MAVLVDLRGEWVQLSRVELCRKEGERKREREEKEGERERGREGEGHDVETTTACGQMLRNVTGSPGL